MLINVVISEIFKRTISHSIQKIFNKYSNKIWCIFTLNWENRLKPFIDLLHCVKISLLWLFIFVVLLVTATRKCSILGLKFWNLPPIHPKPAQSTARDTSATRRRSMCNIGKNQSWNLEYLAVSLYYFKNQ